MMDDKDPIRQSPAAAQASNRLLTQMRHELRTPLNAIIGYSEMLLEDAESLGQRDLTPDLLRIHTAGKHLLTLVNDILDPAKIEAGGLELDPESFVIGIRNGLEAPLNTVISSSEMLLKKIGAPGQEGYVTDLQRVLMAGKNLLAFVNNIKLPVIKGESDSFGLDSPATKTGIRDPVTMISSMNPDAADALEAEDGLLLIVDDNEMNRDILSRNLKRQGHLVKTAATGREALAMLKTEKFELVLLDIMMPEMNGFEVLEHLKADDTLRKIPVIFISALDDIPGKVKAFKMGGVDYITKPFQAEEVKARVESQLKISRLQKRLERQNRELSRKNEELIQAQKRTDLVFSALADVLPGTILDEKYRLEHKIGSGGFGAVYRATHLMLNRPVAVKVFQPITGNDTPEGLERFRLEGISASRITHPNAIAVLDSGITQAGIAYLVMELLHGRPLTDELREKGVLPMARCVKILLSICEALAQAHELGIVHRDIKPDNIFLHQTKDGEVVKVVDFGLAKIIEMAFSPTPQTVTMAGGIIGTPYYIAPERLMNEPYNGRVDIYSLGIMFYEMLTGHVPFQSSGDIYTVAMMHLTKEPQPLREIDPSLPESVETIVMKTLSKNPDERPTARELIDMLKGLGELESPEMQRNHSGGISPGSNTGRTVTDQLTTSAGEPLPPADTDTQVI